VCDDCRRQWYPTRLRALEEHDRYGAPEDDDLTRLVWAPGRGTQRCQEDGRARAVRWNPDATVCGRPVPSRPKK
jgi:hypothetical protein